MDFSRLIIELLGIQDVAIEDVKNFKKDLRLEVTVRQKRSECFCSKCGLQFTSVKEWNFKKIQAPPLGIYQRVDLKFWQLRGFCDECESPSVAEVNWILPRFKSMT